MSSETTNWDTIARYLAGEGSADEQADARQWLAENPVDARVISELDLALTDLKLKGEAQQKIDVEAALAKVKARRDRPELHVVRGGAPRIGRASSLDRPRSRWIGIAAAVTILVTVGTIFWRSRDAVQPAPPVIAARTLTTPVGGRDSLTLPDGSQVILGPGSVLTLAEGFGGNERRMTLAGEAFFAVVHDDAKPFIVVANGVDIRDIGTAFVVHSDAGGVRVAVTEGVVELTAARQSPTRLNAGDVASVSPSGEVTALRGVGAEDDLAWTKGRLVFRDTPLSEVSDDLRRWYGVHLDIPDLSLRRRPVTASFEGDSLRTVLDVIATAIGAVAERRGDTVVLRSQPR